MGERIASFRPKWAVAAVLALVPVLMTGASAQAQSASEPTVTGNWAGYVATGSSISAISGQWTVPSVGTVPGAAGTWVGIGGYGTSDLIQAGTQEVGTPLDSFSGGENYAAFYELLPDDPVYLSQTVSPGDDVQVTITNEGGTCTTSPDSSYGGPASNWSIDIVDSSAHWSQFESLCYWSSSQSSAEWIHEAPTLEVLPIPVGGPLTVTFAGANTATGDFGGRSGTDSISATGAQAVVALPIETTVSALSTAVDGFNVCTYSLTCSPPA